MYVYMCTACIGVQRRSTSLLEEENSQLKETVAWQECSLSTLEKEKHDLVKEVEVAKTTVSPVYTCIYCTLRGRIKGTASALSVIQHGLHEAN